MRQRPTLDVRTMGCVRTQTNRLPSAPGIDRFTHSRPPFKGGSPPPSIKSIAVGSNKSHVQKHDVGLADRRFGRAKADDRRRSQSVNKQR